MLLQFSCHDGALSSDARIDYNQVDTIIGEIAIRNIQRLICGTATMVCFTAMSR